MCRQVRQLSVPLPSVPLLVGGAWGWLDSPALPVLRTPESMRGDHVNELSTPERQFLTCADTAKLLRARLKREWPAVKFSVRSKTYSGGASIDVNWTDGPTDQQVDAITSTYSGARFDGMIDMASYVQHWLEEDGTVTLAHDGGTEGSRGSRPERFGSRRSAGAVLVHLGADYVFTYRALSAAWIDACSAHAEHNGRTRGGEQCGACGSWMPEGDCWTAPTVRHGSDWLAFCCSRECAGRAIARSRSAPS